MEKNPINYRLAGMELISVNIIRKKESLVNGVTFNFDINVESRVDAVKKYLIGIVNVTVKRLDTLEILATISTACLFDVIDFDKHIVLNSAGEKYEVPKDLELAIRPITISTTRGIMFSEFKGTYLHNAFLPIILLDSFQPTLE